uniref:3-ketoacyl-[acyl-carrier-protein] reductase beta subunit n=1 Tax=Erpetoichthys calabaricus TaxID=27687 RepID=A0A8C4SCZ7_ERPCA
MSKLCAVFGGTRGIGKAVSQLLADQGHRVVVLGRSLDSAQAVAEALGGMILALFTLEKYYLKAFETGLEVTCYCTFRDSLLLRTKIEDILAQLHTNLLGSMLTCKYALRGMLQQGGSIVNIGSIVGLKGNTGQSVYSASKAGLVGFTRSLAKEVAAKNIRVNLVAPGFIKTDMTIGINEAEVKKAIPLGRFGDPDEVAQAVVFLLKSPYITGQVLVVDGGLQLAI